MPELIEGIRVDLLEELKNHIRDNVSDEAFSMEHYRGNGKDYTAFINESNCGSIGCVIGHMPFIKTSPEFEPIKSDFQRFACVGSPLPQLELNFDNYCYRVLGLSMGRTVIWTYLFDSDWFMHDNTRAGAVERMEKVIDELRSGTLEIEHLRDELEELGIDI